MYVLDLSTFADGAKAKHLLHDSKVVYLHPVQKSPLVYDIQDQNGKKLYVMRELSSPLGRKLCGIGYEVEYEMRATDGHVIRIKKSNFCGFLTSLLLPLERLSLLAPTMILVTSEKEEFASQRDVGEISQPCCACCMSPPVRKPGQSSNGLSIRIPHHCNWKDIWYLESSGRRTVMSRSLGCCGPKLSDPIEIDMTEMAMASGDLKTLMISTAVWFDISSRGPGVIVYLFWAMIIAAIVVGLYFYML